ncbi:hypothetical protein Salat_0199500 [Sesamum alatum]|uniref:Uncharacterized protein n=1 Tax=Sesamum alatum TaxID=300844 RepID=A0AAE2CY32_9LAMI|nr:hypothetical protein Salat_0199500 [Sesamum alatum]
MPSGPKKRKAAKKKKELKEILGNIAPDDVREESSNIETESIHEKTVDSVIFDGPLMDSKISEDEAVHCTESIDSKNCEEVPFQQPVQKHEEIESLESDDGVVTDCVPVDYITEPQETSETGLETNTEIGIVTNASLVTQSQEEEENRLDEVKFSELIEHVKRSTVEQLEAMEKGRVVLQKILDDLNSIQLMVESRI